MAKSDLDTRIMTKSHQSGIDMKVDMYLSKPFREENKKPKKTESVGIVELLGTYQCKACLNQKITTKEAIQAIKYDAVRSLISRFELLYDDILDQQSEEKPEGAYRKTLYKRYMTTYSSQRCGIPGFYQR
ncbi:hypothetical protein QZH41_004752 [Actinostola sp. cb2023]|nr:hypothetical protein QZH41_004752 [Actinostola sp. cb2023]